MPQEEFDNVHTPASVRVQFVLNKRKRNKTKQMKTTLSRFFVSEIFVSRFQFVFFSAASLEARHGPPAAGRRHGGVGGTRFAGVVDLHGAEQRAVPVVQPETSGK